MTYTCFDIHSYILELLGTLPSSAKNKEAIEDACSMALEDSQNPHTTYPSRGNSFTQAQLEAILIEEAASDIGFLNAYSLAMSAGQDLSADALAALIVRFAYKVFVQCDASAVYGLDFLCNKLEGITDMLPDDDYGPLITMIFGSGI